MDCTAPCCYVQQTSNCQVLKSQIKNRFIYKMPFQKHERGASIFKSQIKGEMYFSISSKNVDEGLAVDVDEGFLLDCLV